jgi:hypothetical protein
LEAEKLSASSEANRRRIYELLEHVNKQSKTFRKQTTQNSDINRNSKLELVAKKSNLETLHLKGLCEPHKSNKHGHHHSKQHGDIVSHVSSEKSQSTCKDSQSPTKQNGKFEAKVTEDTSPGHDDVWSRSSMSTKRRYFDQKHPDHVSPVPDVNMMAEEQNNSADDEMPVPEPEIMTECTSVASLNTQPMVSLFFSF